MPNSCTVWRLKREVIYIKMLGKSYTFQKMSFLINVTVNVFTRPKNAEHFQSPSFRDSTS